MPPVEKPNYTQIPNVILDNMASMTMPEFQVVMALCRQTFGWHKKSEKVSTSQLQAMTGLSKHAVLDALDAALRNGWITRRPAGQTYRYTVNVLEKTSAANAPLPHIVVQQTHRCISGTGAANAPVTSAANAPVPVQQMHQSNAVLLERNAPPKERKETNSKESTTREGVAVEARAKNSPAPAVAIYEEIFERKANSNQRQAIAETVTDCAKWRDVLTTWALKGHSPTNVVDQLDVYANGWQRKNTNGHAPPPPEPKTTRRMTQPIFAKEQP